MKKIVLFWILLITIGVKAFSDEKVTFTTSAPDAVVVGDQFKLSYTVTTQSVRDFRVPSIKGFDVLMGPSRAMRSNTSNDNGKITTTSSISFTYILLAKEEGEFGVAFAIAAILMILTLLINLSATLVGKYFAKRRNV